MVSTPLRWAIAAVFFAGLAVGGWPWGRMAPRVRSALATFGALEVAVALTALGHFFLTDLYHSLYPALYALAGDHPVADQALKAGLAAVILFPPAFLMGGTLPMMGQFMVRVVGRLSTTGTALYSLNTFSSAVGALAAGFAAAHGGVDRLCLGSGHPGRGGALDKTVCPGPAEFRLHLRHRAGVFPGRPVPWITDGQRLGPHPASAPHGVLGVLLLLSAVVIAASPWAFHAATDGLNYVGAGAGWREYLSAVSATAMVLPGILLGAVLPYLLRAVEASRPEPGQIIGQLREGSHATATRNWRGDIWTPS
ncbi:hypothetical protein [Ectothiorhodospira marina]|uniref:Uncharacterized protein n=1 Tax=Ectothiorhodospira marina TaxID=1396821 RepID=A0A1H7QE29_9GAMM|nr:hypothetical protein [Ectothiorhodospira marina]SEL46089.1 hypothetical protein SAMN05444515_11727 [Ectothiorhodospira marina]